MNCEKCHELLSDFLDGTLAGDDQQLFSTHLEECLSCVGLRDDLGVIISAAEACRGGDCYAPPNERALWLRISNTIESESGFNRAGAAAAVPARPRASVWTRLMSKRWELTLPQVTAAVAAIIITVSLVTTLGVQSFHNYAADSAEPTTATLKQGASTRNALLADGYYPRGYVNQQQANINYWQQRVEQRKATWNPRMRESFDRSIHVIDQAVSDSLEDLQRNPHDEVSEEMLNSALHDKMQLLKEFCEY